MNHGNRWSKNRVKVERRKTLHLPQRGPMVPAIIEVRGEGSEGRRWLIVIIAWALMLISLVSPAEKQPFLFWDHIPMGVLVFSSFVGMFAGGAYGNIAIDLLLAVLLVFFIGPFMVARHPSSVWGRAIWWIASLSLLLAWLLPLTWDWELRSGDLMWGFYAFAAAHTLMFMACLMAPFDALPASRKCGFSVVVPNESAEQ